MLFAVLRANEGKCGEARGLVTLEAWPASLPALSVGDFTGGALPMHPTVRNDEN